MEIYLTFGLCVTILLAFLTRYFLKYSIVRCHCNTSMKDKVIIVTGANTGIGYYTALDLAKREGRVILACRNERRGLEARDKIIAETGNKNVVYKQLNLSSLKSVREFAQDIKETEEKLDVLVNNAGVSALGDRVTEDGIVEEMQINYFAPFLLTILLLPMLKKSKGRIVNLSSLCHYRGVVNLDKINKPKMYHDDQVYANSKLCDLIFTRELARRLEGVTVNAVHPGVILTNIVASDAPITTKIFFTTWCWFCCRTAEEGAQTVIYLSVAEEVANVSGEYFVDCKPKFVLWSANDRQLANDLWDFSEKLVSLSDDERTLVQN